MARSDKFKQDIVDSFTKTKDVHKTAEALKLDPDMVVFWLRKQGFDLSGVGAYRRQKGVLSGRHVKFGATVAMLRLEAGMNKTQDLADASGLSSKKVGAIEIGERDITLNEMVLIADALKVHVRQLLERL